MRFLKHSLASLSLMGLAPGAISLLTLPVHAENVVAAEAIESVLTAQQAAWNRGDIDAFMQGYWQSDALRFASGGSVTYGWQATLDGYKARYDTDAKMGVLTFSDLIIETMGEEDALVFGRWSLQRDEDMPGGLFTLHVRKFEDGWKIVADHTSSG